jgi:alkanesulfonate monooxygenase SsuD/methylene tetrahydromethanopterin reductase-like flavin-dependent oxidoreductase (luciferase family)
VTVVNARLYSLPETPPLVLGAAVTEETAALIGHWADGLLTVSAKPDQVRKVVDAFRRNGGDGKPLLMQVGLNWAATEQQALQGAFDQWRYNVLGGEVNWELRSPVDFETATRFVRMEDMRESVLISADPGRHASWLQEFIDLGFEELLLHQVGVNQREFIDVFSSKVLPQLRRTAGY